MGSTVLVGAFEATLSDLVLLAFFLPAVVYVAVSVGTQTETLLIRALATDADIGKVVRREILTGLVLGVAVAILFYPFALIGWGDSTVAFAVALALFASSGGRDKASPRYWSLLWQASRPYRGSGGGRSRSSNDTRGY